MSGRTSLRARSLVPAINCARKSIQRRVPASAGALLLAALSIGCAGARTSASEPEQKPSLGQRPQELSDAEIQSRLASARTNLAAWTLPPLPSLLDDNTAEAYWSDLHASMQQAYELLLPVWILRQEQEDRVATREQREPETLSFSRYYFPARVLSELAPRLLGRGPAELAFFESILVHYSHDVNSALRDCTQGCNSMSHAMRTIVEAAAAIPQAPLTQGTPVVPFRFVPPQTVVSDCHYSGGLQRVQIPLLDDAGAPLAELTDGQLSGLTLSDHVDVPAETTLSGHLAGQVRLRPMGLFDLTQALAFGSKHLTFMPGSLVQDAKSEGDQVRITLPVTTLEGVPPHVSTVPCEALALHSQAAIVEGTHRITPGARLLDAPGGELLGRSNRERPVSIEVQETVDGYAHVTSPAPAWTQPALDVWVRTTFVSPELPGIDVARLERVFPPTHTLQHESELMTASGKSTGIIVQAGTPLHVHRAPPAAAKGEAVATQHGSAQIVSRVLVPGLRPVDGYYFILNAADFEPVSRPSFEDVAHAAQELRQLVEQEISDQD